MSDTIGRPLCDVWVVPHLQQRIKGQVGDWQIDGKSCTITVSQMSDEKYVWLVAIHEAVEAMLCAASGVSQETVDKWDMSYEGEGEPGDDPECPYRWAHEAATLVEHMLARELGVDWHAYNRAVDEL